MGLKTTIDAQQVIKKFDAGLFAEVLDLFESSSVFKSNKELLPFWVGALIFTGHLEKAQALFKKSPLPLTQTISCRFYLAIGLIRQSNYKAGRALLIENLRSKRKIKKSEGLFFIYQGLAFYRFFCGRFEQSKKYANLAFAEAVRQEFIFGEMISKDLLAHSLVHVGQVRKGLKFFEETSKIARRVKNQWLTAAVEISILKFRAQVGIDPHSDLIKLQQALQELSPQDTYSIAELLLEITRQHLLRGQFKKAEDVLSQASDTIYKHQNRRQMALLNIRMAYMLYLQAQHTQALHVIRFAEQNVDLSVDLTLWTQIQGHKQMILQAHGKISEAAEARKQLIDQQKKSQNAINHKILQRPFMGTGKSARGEDALGDLLDLVQNQDPEAPKLIVDSGYYGLLHKYYKLPFGTQALIFDLLPGSVVILDKGNVTFKQKSINSLIRKTLLLMRQEPQSKEQLIEKIWGYEYDPLRHDTLIYSTINKIRKMLEPYGNWIALTESGYRIHSDVRVLFKNSLKVKIQTPALHVAKPQNLLPTKASVSKNQWSELFKDLNFRQLQIVDYLKENPSLSIAELSNKLAISKPTATRDLSQLYSIGILKRAGKGRATRYFIQEKVHEREDL